MASLNLGCTIKCAEHFSPAISVYADMWNGAVGVLVLPCPLMYWLLPNLGYSQKTVDSILYMLLLTRQTPFLVGVEEEPP